jgi:hypothetical protein
VPAEQRLQSDDRAPRRLRRRCTTGWSRSAHESTTPPPPPGAIDYSLKRWAALTRYLHDPALPIDNNFDEQQIRPWATGRKNWLFAGTLMAGSIPNYCRQGCLSLAYWRFLECDESRTGRRKRGTLIAASGRGGAEVPIALSAVATASGGDQLAGHRCTHPAISLT